MSRVEGWVTALHPPPEPTKQKARTRLAEAAPAISPLDPSVITPEMDAELQRLENTPAIRFAKRREGLVSVEGDEDAVRLGRKFEEERMLERHRVSLAEIKSQWTTKIRALSAAQARLVLLDVACQRSEWWDYSEAVPLCGYDARLGMDEADWEEWVESDDARRAYEGHGIGELEPESNEEDRRMELSEVSRYVCRAKGKCTRHAGWQKLKRSDFELEQRILDESLQKLKAREQDLRSRIADIETLRTPPEPHPPLATDPPPHPQVVVRGESPMQVDDGHHISSTAVQLETQYPVAGGGSDHPQIKTTENLKLQAEHVISVGALPPAAPPQTGPSITVDVVMTGEELPV